MIRQFFKDSLIYAVSSVLTRGMSILLVPLYSHALSDSENGLNDMLMGLMLLLAAVATVESSQGVARHLPDPHGIAPKVWVSSGLIISCAGLVVAGLLVAIASPWWTEALGTGNGLCIGWLAFAAACTTGMANLTASTLRASGKARWFSIASLFGVATALICNIMLTGWLRWGVAGVFTAQTLGSAAAVGVGWHFQRALYGWTWSRPAVNRILSFSLPLVPGAVGMCALMYANRFAITDLLSVGDAGRYGMVNRASLIVGIAMLGVSGALAPLVYARHRDEGTRRQLRRLLHLFTGLAAVVVAGLALMAREILPLLGAGSYSPWAYLAGFQAPAVMLSQMYVFFPGATIAGRTFSITLITLFSAVANIVLCYVLIPPMGLPGAGLAALLSAGLSLAAHAWCSQRLYPVPHQWSSLLGAAAITGGCILLSSETGGNLPWQGFPVRLGLFVACAAGCAVVLRPWRLLKEP